MRAFGRLARDRRGGIAILAALLLSVLIGAAAFAVDIAAAQLEARRLQGIADAAALAAAGDPANARDRAEALVSSSRFPRSITMGLVTGSYARDAATPPARRFTPGAGGDAVQVTLSAPSPTFFARFFGQASITIARKAVAAGDRRVAFSIGSRLASVNGGVANAYLSALAGGSVSLSVMDHEALTGVDVDLFAFLTALRTTASLRGASYDQLLGATVTAPQALGALAATLEGSGRGAAAAAIRALAARAGTRGISLAALVDPGRLGEQVTGGLSLVRVDAMALATELLQLAVPGRQVAFDLPAGLPGLASAHVTVAIGERTRSTPWIAVTDIGTPVIRTGQARVHVDVRLLDVPLPGILGPVAVHVPILLDLAGAEARLAAVDCSAIGRSATIEARVSPASIAIAALPAGLDDFSRPLVLARARLVDTPLVDVEGLAQVDTGAAEPWQALRFDAAQIASGTPRRIAASKPVGGITASLVSRLSLRATVVGLGLPLDPLFAGIGSAIMVAAPAIDALLEQVTGAIGLRYGEADVRVTGLGCGRAMLVA